MIEYYKNNTLKGEIVVMVFASEYNDVEESEIVEKISILKEEGYSNKDISIIISKLYGINKNKIYKLTME